MNKVVYFLGKIAIVLNKSLFKHCLEVFQRNFSAAGGSGENFIHPKLLRKRRRLGAPAHYSPLVDGQEPVGPSGEFGQLDYTLLHLWVGAEQRSLPLL